MFRHKTIPSLLVGASLVLSAATTSAEGLFAPNDVSILLEAPASPDDPRVRADQILPGGLVAAARATFGGGTGLTANGDGSAGVPEIDLSLFENRVADWHVASLRIDPGAPGLGAAFEAFGRLMQIRLVVQPVDGNGKVKDEAIHLVYGFHMRKDDGAAVCPLRAIPTEDDIAAFGAALDALTEIKTAIAEEGITTDGRPLGVHPAFDRPETATVLTDMLQNFIAVHLPPERLVGLSVAGLPAGAPEPWIFAALNRDPETGGFKALPAPALEQPIGDSGLPRVRQMLSFLNDRQHGEVLPPALTRNQLPVDCMMNPILARLDNPSQPSSEHGTSTTGLFGRGNNNAADAAMVAALIADPARAHFFNTDCISCHTETRREIDAATDQTAKAREIAEAHDIDPATMPIDMPFSHWNVRAFGWFPGFPQQRDAHETTVRRTATETAEVLECLNEGDWRDLTVPCIATEKDVAAEEEVVVLDQGWSDDIRAGYYHKSQGSALMPLRYFLALETAAGGERFASPENLARYGFLPSDFAGSVIQQNGVDRIDLPRLPVGMALTDRDGEPHVGLNCAACHSADVIAGGQRLRVDGAPAATDFDQFVIDLADAVQQTAQIRRAEDGTPEPTPRFERFLGRVALIDPLPFLKDRGGAVADALAFAAAFQGEMALRRPAHPSGPGRVDALTQIINALAAKDLGIRTNHATPAAPTSHPALWLTPELEMVQWNMAAADPLGRNTGQALGVLGKANLLDGLPFTSSANLETLELNETWVDMLAPPAWPADLLGEIDTAQAETGRDLFKQHCLKCHNAPPFEMTDPGDNENGDTFIKVTPVPLPVVGTDPVYTNTFTGRWVSVAPVKELLEFDGQTEPAAVFLGSSVGAVTEALREKARSRGQTVSEPRLRPASHQDCRGRPDDAADEPCGYRPPFDGGALKAGPLIGLWATGPYFHNGSVRTVFEVISPPEERAGTFWIGDRTVDADHLGFASTETENAYLFDTKIPGNGNGGHDFWADNPLTEDERLAIIEYLKDPAQFPMPQ